MRLSQYLIGFFIVVIAFAAFGVTYVSLSSTDKYNVSISSDFQSAYTNNSGLTDLTEEITGVGVDTLDSVDEAKQLEDDFSDPSKAMIKSLKITKDSFDVAKGLLLTVSNTLKIPPIITAILIGILLISITFAIITMVFRFKS